MLKTLKKEEAKLVKGPRFPNSMNISSFKDPIFERKKKDGERKTHTHIYIKVKKNLSCLYLPTQKSQSEMREWHRIQSSYEMSVCLKASGLGPFVVESATKLQGSFNFC